MSLEPIVIGNATLFHGDCLDYLKSLPDNSVDSVICDPPAGISFMNKEFDSDRGGRDRWIDWLASIFKEVYRVMKPGAHGLVWALPRTSHWTGTALENAGFDLRDRINYIFDASELAKAFFGSLNDAQLEVLERLMESQDPARVQHIFGSGFPKAANISKMLDAMVGAEREVVGWKVEPDGRVMGIEPKAHARICNPSDKSDRKMGADNRSLADRKLLTAPATDLAKQWDGWFSALKPAVEDYWLIRKPIEGSIAANVMKWECGGLNVDACRVVSDDLPNPCKGTGWAAQDKKNAEQGYRPSAYYAEQDGVDYSPNTLGRYPAHVIHDGSPAVCGRFPNTGASNTRQPTGKPKYTGSENDSNAMRASATLDTTIRGHIDSGSASRFFKSCPIDPFVYHSKASSSDRNEGCDGLKENQYSHDGRNKQIENPYQRNNSVASNHHPTVKSTSLFSYFATLLTPPNGIILDPFMGSGTTGVAAVKLGYRFIGCELEEEYFAICKARIEAAQRQGSLF